MHAGSKLLLPLRSHGNTSTLISMTELHGGCHFPCGSESLSREKTNTFFFDLQCLVVLDIIDGQELLAEKIKFIGFRKKRKPFNL